MFRKFVLGPPAVLALAALVCATACDYSARPQRRTEPYVISVDSVSVPTAVTIGETLCVRLAAVLPNDCHAFESIEARYDSLRLELTVWGERLVFGPCSRIGVELNEEHCRADLVPGLLRILVHQPDGTVLADSVVVQPAAAADLDSRMDHPSVGGSRGS